MINTASINQGLISARPYYKSVNPGIMSVFSIQSKAAKIALKAVGIAKMGRKVKRADDRPAAIGELLGGYTTGKLKAPIKRPIVRAHVVATRTDHDLFRKNGMGGRGWYDRAHREKMVIVYHDANRAGPHVDVHIGRVSLVYRVKPDLYKEIRYNNQGYLTENSRRAILEHIRQEVNGNSRVAQNLDHSRSNARASWTNGDRDARFYGAGFTRQVVLETEVDIYKAHWNGPIEMYAPDINPHRATYLYRLYPGEGSRAPILIWGTKSAGPPKLQDRLHLNNVHPEDLGQMHIKADMSTSTAKYDGSSCYVVIDKDGTTVWSPRVSKSTGQQIEYTHKLDGIALVQSDESIVAMGELLFVKDGEYLSSAQGSGILNSNALLPRGVKPEIRLYRVDRVGRNQTWKLPFWENRQLQQRVAKLDKKFKVVELMDPETAKLKGFEGVVTIPVDESVNEGFKMKWWADPYDWQITKVDFRDGEKGGIAGVVHVVSLESGKEFKLGPGQMGDHALARDMMANPSSYEGQVIKVNSKQGFEGRAAKVIGFHDDKGLAV